MAGTKRKLAAILSADVVGYSRLMQDDEAATVETLQKYRAAIDRIVRQHGGRIVNAPGDNIFAEFPSAVEAVAAAVEIQKNVEGRNAELTDSRRMRFRVGVNLGDVIEAPDGTIYGDGVNVAARMEALADEGSIAISRTVYDAVEGKLDFGFDYLGEQPVKNITRPVRVYRVRGDRARAHTEPARTRKAGRRKMVLAVAGAAVILAGAGAAWQFAGPRSPPATDATVATIPALPSGPSVAVLPFVNMSEDPEQEYFADGLTQDIIDRLTRFRELFVFARGSTRGYKGRDVSAQDVRNDLGADFIVEGSVRRSGDNIRVSAQPHRGRIRRPEMERFIRRYARRRLRAAGQNIRPDRG